jgi:uncharacterized membrane protein
MRRLREKAAVAPDLGIFRRLRASGSQVGRSRRENAGAYAILRAFRKAAPHVEGTLLRPLLIALAIAFPLITHAAVVSRSGSLTLASLAVLAALVLLPRLVRWQALAWCAVPLVVLGLFWLWRVHAVWLPLYATPVLISFGVAWLFGHSLAAGSTPLIERVARLLHDTEISPEVSRYARRVTVAWTVLMTVMGLWNLALALIARPDGVLLMMGIQPPFTVAVETWSLFANFLNYVIVAVFFVVEYIFRGSRFRDHQKRYRNMFEFMRRAAAVGPRVFRARND